MKGRKRKEKEKTNIVLPLDQSFVNILTYTQLDFFPPSTHEQNLDYIVMFF